MKRELLICGDFSAIVKISACRFRSRSDHWFIAGRQSEAGADDEQAVLVANSMTGVS